MGRFIRAACSILGWALVFVGLLAITTLLPAWFLSYWWEFPLICPATLTTGLVCGLITWLFVAVFHLRRETLFLPGQYGEEFLEKARQILGDMGYEVVSRSQDQVVTRPGFHSFLLGGGILVRQEGNQTRVVGPKVVAEVVQKRLRLQKHFNKVQQSCEESRRRQEGHLLQRVQITLAVKPQQLAEIQRQVIEPLAKEGKVTCTLNILAFSEDGITETTLDDTIRPWLEEQGLQAEIHRGHVAVGDPLHQTPVPRLDDTLPQMIRVR